MQLLPQHKKYLPRLLFVCVLLVSGYGGYTWWQLRIAHSTFENYYHFRGCQQLVSRTATSGVCALTSGATITIVSDQGKWYLKGDEPGGFW